MDGTRRRRMVRMAPVLAVGMLGILIAAPNAAGQAAIDQYIPKGDPAGTGGGGSIATPYGTQGPAAPAVKAIKQDTGSGSGSGGTLPLTDYPSTPWLWIILALLVVGGLSRVAFKEMKRRGVLGTS
jgi:hypothetical protein